MILSRGRMFPGCAAGAASGRFHPVTRRRVRKPAQDPGDRPVETRRSGRIAVAILVLSVLLLVLALATRKIWTVDYWWQWKTGEYVAQHGVPRTDVFSYTNLGHPRVEIRWGYCLALWLLTSTLGHGAAVVAKITLVILAFACMGTLAAIPRPWRGETSTVIAAALVAIAALASSQRFYERPETVSYALFAVFVAIVDTCRRRWSRAAWGLPALQIVWVNTHGLFPLGPAVVAFWAAEEGLAALAARSGSRRRTPEDLARLRRALAVLAATCAACLCNPFLFRAVLLAFLQFRVLHGTAQKGFFVEFLSPFSAPGNWVALRYYAVLVAAALISWLVNLRKSSTFWTLLVGASLYLSATAVRNVPLFALAAVPFTVRNLTEAAEHSKSRLRAWLPAARLLLLTATALFSLHQVRLAVTDRFAVTQGDTNQFGIGIARHRYPEEAADFLAASGASGPIFNPPGIGSYLIARGHRVFIDPRGEEHMERIIDEYQGIVDAPARFDDSEKRWGFRVAVLWTEQVSIVDHLRRRPDWRLVHADPVAVVLFRRDEAPTVPELSLGGPQGERWFEQVRRSLGPPPRWSDRGFLTRTASPAPYVAISNFCLAMGAVPYGRFFNEWAFEAYPPAFAR